MICKGFRKDFEIAVNGYKTICYELLSEMITFIFMENSARRLIKNLEILPQLGRQRCFELGNPFYYQDAADAGQPGNEKGNYYRKELSSGELYLVTVEIKPSAGDSFEFKDTIIRKLR